MTSRKSSGSVSRADLTNVLGENPQVLDRSMKENEPIYRPCDFIAPGKGFTDFMFRNSERFIRSNNCVRDFAYTAVLGAVHLGYAVGAYVGISKLVE